MTDGRSYDNVNAPAQLFRRTGIKCYAVGIGRKFNRRQLYQIAAGNRRHVLTAGFRNLGSIVNTIQRRTCRGIPSCLSICQSVSQSACLPVGLPNYLPSYPSVRLSVSLSVVLSVYLSVCLSGPPFACFCLSVSVCSSMSVSLLVCFVY